MLVKYVADFILDVSGLRSWAEKVGKRLGEQAGDHIVEKLSKRFPSAGVDSEQLNTGYTPEATGDFVIPLDQEQLEVRIRELKERVQSLDTESGSHDSRLPPILDELAALSKANKQPLDSANYRARAAVIRSHNARVGFGNEIEFASPTQGRSFRVRLPSVPRGVSVLVAACGVVVFLAIVNLLLKNSGHSHFEEIRAAENELTGGSQIVGIAPTVPPKDLRILNNDEPGMPVDLDPELRSGKTTVVYFHSDLCPGSRQMKPLVARLAEARPDMNIFEINIDRPSASEIDFDSPVSEQLDVDVVPSFRVFEPNGTLLAEKESAKDWVRSVMRDEGIAR